MERCKGSGRPGMTPKGDRHEWDEFRAGKLRCWHCKRFIAHNRALRLRPHKPR